MIDISNDQRIIFLYNIYVTIEEVHKLHKEGWLEKFVTVLDKVNSVFA